MTEHTKESIDRCAKVFVSWSWLAGILLGLISVGAGIAWAASNRLQETDERVTKIENTCLKIVTVEAKIDTLLSRTK